MSKLPQMVQALLDPAAYPEKAEKIELAQTQMSFVFFTGGSAYKVKKPVDLGYLDYTTLEKRLFFCQKEVELNRRLCPDTYLGVLSITRDNKGSISIDGKGEVIEYAVKMRKLPRESMMDVLLEKNQVSPEMVKTVAKKLLGFHQAADVVKTFGGLDTVVQNTEENFTQVRKYIGRTVSQQTYDSIKDYSDSFLKKNANLFHKRVAEGRIRDCHGDLHAAHICLTDDICIYDCIEFNDRFRYTDVASEIAFLAMDLDHFGRADLSGIFVDAYVEMSQDKEIKELLNFYKCYRAYVRGKVNCFKLDDPNIPEKERAEALATGRSYFRLAESYL